MVQVEVEIELPAPRMPVKTDAPVAGAEAGWPAAFVGRAPKVSAQAYLSRVRDFIAKHRCKPSETLGGPGYSIANAIRAAKARGAFSVAELNELSRLQEVQQTETAASNALQAPACATPPVGEPDGTPSVAPAVHDPCGDGKLPDATASSSSALEPYFERQVDAWCGMHALNNYLGGPYVTQDACKRAARRWSPC